MKTKKFLVALVSVCLILVFLIAGCSSPAPAPSPTSTATSKPAPAPSSPAPAASKPSGVTPEAGWPKAISLGTAASAGFGYIAVTSMSVMIQNYMGVTASPEALGGSAAVFNAIGGKKVEMGLGYASVAQQAYEGTDAWKGKPIPGLRITFGGPVSVYPLAVMADSPVKSVTDLKGKKVMFDNPANPFFKAYFNLLLETYGMTTNDITPLQWTDEAQISEGLFNGTIAAGMCPAVIAGTTPTWLELSKKKPIRFLDIPKDKLEAIVAKLGKSTMVVVLKAGLYNGLDTDINIIAQHFVLIADKDVPDSFVTKMLKVYWDEHLAEYEKYHPSLIPMNAKNTLIITDVIPFHPGTVKYYQEKNLWTPTLQQMQEKLLAKSK